MHQFADWGTSGFKAITWRKVELVRDLVLQVRLLLLWLGQVFPCVVVSVRPDATSAAVTGLTSRIATLLSTWRLAVCLRTQGFSVLSTDLDIVLLKNPLDPQARRLLQLSSCNNYS